MVPRVVDLGPVDEYHQVGVLLYGARFAKVFHAGGLLADGGRGAPELGDSYDRDLELHREDLEVSRYPGDLLDAALTEAGDMHELDIVYDYEPYVLSCHQLAGLGAHLEHRDVTGVIDEDGGVGQDTRAGDYIDEPLVADAPGAVVAGVYARVGAQEPLGELYL